MAVLACFACLCAGCGIYGEYVARGVEDRVASNPASVRLTPREFQHQEDQLKDRVIEIEGVIGHIMDKGGCPAVTLRPNLGCFFGRDRKKQIKRLKVGQTVILKGWVDPVSGFLDACMVVR